MNVKKWMMITGLLLSLNGLSALGTERTMPPEQTPPTQDSGDTCQPVQDGNGVDISQPGNQDGGGFNCGDGDTDNGGGCGDSWDSGDCGGFLG